MERILVIDDDTELCELLQDYLGGEGFHVDAVHSWGSWQRGGDGTSL